ncbi:MAG: sigma-70 family RNA polymerase sigma factor [Clostridia bacterium]|nr:sigma-70 family RNA polymerase sigma factor [Clostridia bacterium]
MLPIILNIVDDDDRAFVEKIYVRYEKQLYLISMKYLNNHHDAQDCVHDTIKIIIDGIEKFKIAQNVGYIEKLITIVCRNCALNTLRVKKYKNEHELSLCRYNYEDDEYEEIDIPDYSSCVDKLYISEESCEHLHNLINKLDDKYRDVALLKSLGFDNRGIAEIMHISENLVSQRYKRAKDQLLKMGGKDLYAE